MSSFSPILLPVDFSERSVWAAHYARLLAGRFHSELTLLHTFVSDERREGAVQDLEAFGSRELAGIAVRTRAVDGDPGVTIVQLARDERSSLIIMPTHGYGPFRRFLLGSNTARVLHDAHCPVWTGVHVDEAVDDSAPFRHVLCAVDLGEESHKAVCWALTFAHEFGAALTLVHATEQPDSREAAAAEVHGLLRAAGADANVLVEPGDPAKAICTAAERVHANLLVIARGSAAGASGRLRANAHAIIRMSPCPVVSV
jgi:nucleotide-binding universal stress UspA family protein